MDLRKTASEAEDVAAGFRLFRFPLPEHEADITDLIVEFYGISSSMQKLYSLSHDPRYSRNWPLVERDAFLVQSSLKYTLSDIHDFFGRLDPDRSRADKFREVWRTIELFFWEESKSSLRIRLAKYRVFLIELADVLLSKLQELSLHQAHRDGIKLLLATQERQRIPDHFGRMSLSRNPSSAGSASASASGNSTEPSSPVSDRRLRRGSFERTRPPHLPPQSPQSPLSPLSPSPRGFNIPPPPPLAPEAPSSPLTGSASATTSTSQSSRSDTIRDHWIHDVLSRDEPETPFQSEGRQVVGCSGKPNPGIKRELQEMGFVLLTRMHLSAQMRVYFYLRESDNRIRIVIRVPRDGEKEYYCLPLNLLEVIRQGPVLRLCRRRDSGSELHEWASLYFTTIESMTAFFCSFLALRAQDRYKPVSSIRDWEMEGEEEIFAGEIIEGGYKRGFRVFQDKNTETVRFQSSIHRGNSDRTPIWTAFVTRSIGRRDWLTSLDTKTVVIRYLKPMVMVPEDDCVPPRLSTGQHYLRFSSRHDADDFLDTMDEVIDEYTRSVRYV